MVVVQSILQAGSTACITNGQTSFAMHTTGFRQLFNFFALPISCFAADQLKNIWVEGLKSLAKPVQVFFATSIHHTIKPNQTQQKETDAGPSESKPKRQKRRKTGPEAGEDPGGPRMGNKNHLCGRESGK